MEGLLKAVSKPAASVKKIVLHAYFFLGERQERLN
jgi:hypothetical protein